MERQYNNGDFEKLLRDNANQYRMYPSEKVWDGIYSALHTRRRWYGYTAMILLLITGSVASYFIFSNTGSDKKNNIAAKKQETTSPLPAETPKATATFSPEQSIKQSAVVYDLKKLIEKTPSIDLSALNTAPMADKPVEETVTGENELSDESATAQILAETSVSEPEMILPQQQYDLIAEKVNTEEKADVNILEKSMATTELVDELTKQKINEAVSALTSQQLLITLSKKQPKVTAQVYFTPTVSYRKLTENKRVYNGTGFNYPVIDLNNVVQHKPAMGLEFGIEGKYRMQDKLSFKAGLQFNINRYDIRAYSHPTEIATVAINSGFGVDSLATLSNYRNFNGNSPNWLENFYFQVSFPLGLEMILADKKNIKVGISATIQPTYVLGDRAYVISSDYKNYAKFPDLMRRWNLSTGFGAFVSYSTGRINWQVGPHVRYQHLSSFVSQLTVKEKLFSTGLKVGATINKKR
jgi:hypothetical protein